MLSLYDWCGLIHVFLIDRVTSLTYTNQILKTSRQRHTVSSMNHCRSRLPPRMISTLYWQAISSVPTLNCKRKAPDRPYSICPSTMVWLKFTINLLETTTCSAWYSPVTHRLWKALRQFWHKRPCDDCNRCLLIVFKALQLFIGYMAPVSVVNVRMSAHAGLVGSYHLAPSSSGWIILPHLGSVQSSKGSNHLTLSGSWHILSSP